MNKKVVVLVKKDFLSGQIIISVCKDEGNRKKPELLFELSSWTIVEKRIYKGYPPSRHF